MVVLVIYDLLTGEAKRKVAVLDVGDSWVPLEPFSLEEGEGAFLEAGHQ